VNNNKELLELLENPEIFNINRLNAHRTHQYYQTIKVAQAKDAMPWRYCLNERGQFSYSKYISHELEHAMHNYELPEIHKTVLFINLKEMGVDEDGCWGTR